MPAWNGIAGCEMLKLRGPGGLLMSALPGRVRMKMPGNGPPPVLDDLDDGKPRLGRTFEPRSLW
jgi:hypothetical protein